MSEWRLSIGNRFTGLVVCPDPKWPSMWRIHYGGRISEMVNLPRAKDAAINWVGGQRYPLGAPGNACGGVLQADRHLRRSFAARHADRCEGIQTAGLVRRLSRWPLAMPITRAVTFRRACAPGRGHPARNPHHDAARRSLCDRRWGVRPRWS